MSEQTIRATVPVGVLFDKGLPPGGWGDWYRDAIHGTLLKRWHLRTAIEKGGQRLTGSCRIRRVRKIG